MDANGTVIEEFIDDHNLVCVNREGTHYNNTQNTETALDLTFVSIAIAGICIWNSGKTYLASLCCKVPRFILKRERKFLDGN